MTYVFIKIVAIITMLIDHVGYVLLGNDMMCRMIGRISFPLFCFLLVNGYYHTSNKIKYLGRMLIFAFISELIYDFAFYDGINMNSQNIFFTLAIGLLAILVTEVYKDFIEARLNKILQIFMLVIGKILILCSFMYINEFIEADYGWYGIMLIYFLYLTYGAKVRNRIMMCASVSFVNFVKILVANSIIQAYSIFSITFLIFFQEKEVSVPKSMKILGYVFYPAHLLIIFLIKSFL